MTNGMDGMEEGNMDKDKWMEGRNNGRIMEEWNASN